jgi:hypothetical protein
VRTALLVFLSLLVGGLLAVIVDRRVMRPRREADALVSAARPYASASHESAWLTAESLLAQAELRHRDRDDIRELRARIAAGRAGEKQKDEVITAGALESCLGAIDKAGLAADVARIRAATTLSKRDQLVECMKVQLQHLGEIAAHAPPSAAPSVVTSAVGPASASAKPCPPGSPLCP